MRRIRRGLLTAVVVPAVLLAGACGSSGEPSTGMASTGSPAGSPAPVSPELDAVQVTVDGKTASLKLPARPFTATAGSRVLVEGTGPAISADQVVTANVLAVNGKDGKELENSYAKTPVRLTLSESSLLPDIRTALLGRPVGSRILVASPAGAAVAEAGIAAGDTLVFLFDLTAARTPLTQAQGTPVPPKPGLPTVTMGATAKDPATFSVPAGQPPKTTIAQPLIVGTGPKVVAGQRVRVSYTGVTWRDPANPFDFSGRQPSGFAEFDVGRGQLIKAWDTHLVGQPIGSRLLLVVPPADGYGARGSGEQIKGTDTLIFVLDILDAG